jgi:hypothetical protein
MAFTKIVKSRLGLANIHEPNVTMGAYLADGKLHKARSVAFRINRALLNVLGWTEDRFYIGVLEGTDSDKGFLQLVLDEKGYVAARLTRGGETNQGVAISVTIERFNHYVLNECPVPSQPISFIVEGNALIIECPDWLRFNPLSVPEPEPVQQKEEKPARNPPREVVVDMSGQRRPIGKRRV